jgi:2-polyprenyl-3-methyl-5-hydroxy-6-metoxy-1,4-benzoquinol methylase
VGIGTDMLTPILKNFNYKVSTMDIIDELNPDFVGSLHELDKVVENKKFDLIVCSHILEHIPYNLFETCLEQIQRHSRYSLIYLPDSGIAFGAELRILPKWRKIFTLFLPIFKFKKIHFNGEHYWELDLKETPRKKVINDISQYFKIIKKYRNQHWDNSYNFILESK